MVLALQRLGAEVHGYSLAPVTDPSMFDALGLETLCTSHRIADIRDQDALIAAVEDVQPDIAIHMAAQPIVSLGYKEPVETFAVNVMGTAHFLEACRKAQVTRVLVVSSDKCYRNDETGVPFREEDPLGGHDPYSASKAGTEIVVGSWRASFLNAESGTSLASARAGNVIGGGDWSQDRLLPDAARAFAKGESLLIRSPDSVRPWQHVLEPVFGYLALIEQMLDDPTLAQGWNFGPIPPEGVAVRGVVDNAVAAWGEGAAWTLPPDYKEPKFEEAKLLLLDCERVTTKLSWKPALSLPEAVSWTMDWYRTFYEQGREATRALSDDQISQYLGHYARADDHG